MPVSQSPSWANLKNKPTTLAGFGITDASQLGAGQTWQSFTGSRSLGTTYTNSTGKAIQVMVRINGLGSNATATSTVDGVSGPEVYGAASTGITVYVIVPAGKTYSVSCSPGSIATWLELR